MDTKPMPITPSLILPFDPPNSVIPEKRPSPEWLSTPKHHKETYTIYRTPEHLSPSSSDTLEVSEPSPPCSQPDPSTMEDAIHIASDEAIAHLLLGLGRDL